MVIEDGGDGLSDSVRGVLRTNWPQLLKKSPRHLRLAVTRTPSRDDHALELGESWTFRDGEAISVAFNESNYQPGDWKQSRPDVASDPLEGLAVLPPCRERERARVTFAEQPIVSVVEVPSVMERIAGMVENEAQRQEVLSEVYGASGLHGEGGSGAGDGAGGRRGVG